jgi:eukaryotic-like serine/threonine-protein kinase
MQRICFIVLMSYTALVCVASAQQLTANCSNDWTEYHRTNMERWNPCETVLNSTNVGNLILKWRFATGGVVNSNPAVVNGVVYIGSDDHHAYALNANTGAELGSYFMKGGGVDSGPAVANGVVYFGSADRHVYALNARTGAKLWSYLTGGAVFSSPTVANGAVYAGSRVDGKVFALNATTGALLWSFTTGGDVDSSPAVANGAVYVDSHDGNLYALNAPPGICYGAIQSETKSRHSRPQ